MDVDLAKGSRRHWIVLCIGLVVGMLMGAVMSARAGATLVTFRAGNKIFADDINANFAALNAEIDALHAEVALLARRTDVPVVTAWQDYQTALSDANSATTYLAPVPGRWRRVGDSMEIQISVTLPATPVGGGLWYVELPTKEEVGDEAHPVIDDTKIPARANVGDVLAYDSSVGTYYSGAVSVGGSLRSLLMAMHGSGLSAPAYPFAFAADDFIVLRATVPITGWAATGE